ncbi:MAG: hypothetical protein IIV41_03805 [Akkermansia sp.]|nr:hypothetical protein [Akkermansia sp.]
MDVHGLLCHDAAVDGLLHDLHGCGLQLQNCCFSDHTVAHTAGDHAAIQIAAAVCIQTDLQFCSVVAIIVGVLPGLAAIGRVLPLVAQVVAFGFHLEGVQLAQSTIFHILRLSHDGDFAGTDSHDCCFGSNLVAEDIGDFAAILLTVTVCTQDGLQHCGVIAGRIALLPDCAVIGGVVPLIDQAVAGGGCGEFHSVIHDTCVADRLCSEGQFHFLCDDGNNLRFDAVAFCIGDDDLILLTVTVGLEFHGQGCFGAGGLQPGVLFSVEVAEMVKLTNAATTVYWVESHGLEGQFTTMRGALINVAPVLREKLFEAGRSCICTSATLSTGERGMGYFAGRVGAESARPLQIGSPFDFEKQMRIIVARSMPPPPPASEDDEYHPALADWIMRSLDESQGRAFVLFTSYKLLSAMAVRLRPFCQERGWPLLVQGDELNRSQMVHSFRENIGSVLLGTDSFWTGVDVPGEALSNVIVTKIPFESPGNPLVEARIEDITARGGNAFRDYSLPEAVLKFRQGIGRLIRSRTDTGIVTILDSRVTNKFYGARFMYALPATAPRAFL